MSDKKEIVVMIQDCEDYVFLGAESSSKICSQFNKACSELANIDLNPDEYEIHVRVVKKEKKND